MAGAGRDADMMLGCTEAELLTILFSDVRLVVDSGVGRKLGEAGGGAGGGKGGKGRKKGSGSKGGKGGRNRTG